MAQDKELMTTTAKASKNKRKRPRVSAEEQLRQESDEKYNKLVYMATKALHKEAKIVKSFECQKIVRKLKQQDGASNQKLQDRLQEMKKFPLDRLVDVCLQRLGLPNLNPNPTEATSPNTEENKKEPDGSKVRDDSQLLEPMLRHKRLVTGMETWNEKVTDYRRWYLRRQERVTEVPEFVSKPTKQKKKSEKKASRDTPSASNDLFVCLSGATADNDERNHYGPGEADDEYTSLVKKKKNRPGQRSRQAKAMAIKARKEGRTWDHSLNWREKKPKGDEETSHQHTNEAPSKVQPEEIAAMGKTWKEEGQAHPSWAAQKSQKNGIVEFRGKKITFD